MSQLLEYHAKHMLRFRWLQTVLCACFLFILLEQHGVCQTKEPAYKRHSKEIENLNHPVARLVKEWNKLTGARDFTDSTKQYKIRAQVIGFTEEDITLRKAVGGNAVIVPLAKLDPSHSKEVARLIVLEKQIPSEVARYKETHAELKKNTVNSRGMDGLVEEIKQYKIPVKDIIQFNEIPSKITPEHAGKMVIIEARYKDLDLHSDVNKKHIFHSNNPCHPNGKMGSTLHGDFSTTRRYPQLIMNLTLTRMANSLTSQLPNGVFILAAYS